MDGFVNPLEAHLGYWMRSVSNHVSQAFRLKLQARDVSVAEWVALRELWDFQELAPSILAGRMGVSRGAVSKVVDRLAKRGFALRRPGGEDRRYQALTLTPAGRALVPELAQLADANDAEFFGHLSDADRSALERIVRDIVRRGECGLFRLNRTGLAKPAGMEDAMEIRIVDVMTACTKESDEGRMSFPEVVSRLIEAGIERYHADLRRGEKTFYLPDGESHVVASRPVEAQPARAFSASAVEAAVHRVQAGGTTYRGFCDEIAEAGCVGYLVSIPGRRAVYYGRTGETHVEMFPGAN